MIHGWPPPGAVDPRYPAGALLASEFSRDVEELRKELRRVCLITKRNLAHFARHSPYLSSSSR